MSRYGCVIKSSGDRALVSTTRRGVCDGCGERASCSFDKALGEGKPEELEVLNPVHAEAGDFVEFDLPGHTELKISLVLWAVPLLGLVAGAAAGASLHDVLSMDRDLATLLGAFAGLALFFLPVKLLDRKAKRDDRLTPRILRVVNPTQCPEGRKPASG